MKTSVIEVHDMLSVLSVDEVERRIGEVTGVESVTVNHAAGSATVRYDETRLGATDIKSAVRQRAHESAAPAAASPGDSHEGHTAPGAPPAISSPAAPKTPPVAPATAGASAGTPQQDTVRYDETLLDVDDIKAAVHLRGQQPEGESPPKHATEHKPARKGDVAPTSEATPGAQPSAAETTVPEAAPDAPAAVSVPSVPSAPEAAVPKGRPVAPGAVRAPVAAKFKM